MIYIHQLPTQYMSFFQALNELYFIMLLKRPTSFIIEDKTAAMKLFIWANNVLLSAELVIVAAIMLTFCRSRK